MITYNQLRNLIESKKTGAVVKGHRGHPLKKQPSVKAHEDAMYWHIKKMHHHEALYDKHGDKTDRLLAKDHERAADHHMNRAEELREKQ